LSVIEEQLLWLVEQLGVRYSSQATRPQVPLVIEIHVTRHEQLSRTVSATSQHSQTVHPQCEIFSPSPDPTENEEEEEAKQTLPKNVCRALEISSELGPWVNVSIHEGRASKIVDLHFPVTELSAEQSLSIVSCGPAALCDEVRSQAKATMAQGSWKYVRYLEECFSW
jgi:hypothetical protein